MTTLTNDRPETWKYMPQAIEGLRIVLTGGTSGIGRTTALLLAQQGAKVLIFGRHQRVLDEAMRDLSPVADHVVPMTADHAHEEDVDRVFQAADDELGGVDVLINNAADPAGPLSTTEPAEYRYVVENNLLGYIACAKRALTRMQRQQGGTIINVGSMSAEARGASSDLYVATKSGIRGWSDALGKQLSEDNIRVTLIEPGSVGADFRDQSPEEDRKQEKKGRMLFTEPLAEMILYVIQQPQNVYIPFVQIQPIKQIVGG